MPEFRYRAVTAAAQTIDGRMEAVDRATIVDRLHHLGHTPLRIEELGPSRLGSIFTMELLPTRRLGASFLSLVSSQLATLLKAGLVLDDALGILEELVENEREKASIRTLIEAISSGKTLAEALAAQKRIFPDYFVNLVRAGEAGGNLDLVFDRIAEFIARVRHQHR